MRRVLIVDDDPKVCDVLDRYLAHAGYATAQARDGTRALELARTWAPDLVVLDLMLPGVGGVEVCARLRREQNGVPVIMLTARSTEEDKVTGLATGADDYLTKPFSPRELVARVEAVLRRARSKGRRIVAGRLEIDEERCEVTIDGEQVKLTATELKMLTIMARHPGRVFRREELARQALGDDFEGLDRTVDAHVKNLRRKVGSATIVTVFGIGYKLVA
ncbi:MAG TPA: response regulator transcription factor [Thermoanaerobaculia bacterium]|jgi:DNA-binding response OmpR family regulator|nr:response regulator transcription factor [Thermoanaerobaculia bacterium]